ncbi:MAG: fumarate reductase subunit D [Gammaproteobacteria bacterium]|nr:fumarate reductase subunit D [Gammaproteobacteria bacterium]
MRRKRSHEPVFWSLFGAGGVVVAFILPAMVVASGLAIPLGFLSVDQLSYDRIHEFSRTWYGGVFLFFTISLSFWHGLHRIYLSLHDLGVHHYRQFYRWLCYGLAMTGTVFTAFFLFLS